MARSFCALTAVVAGLSRRGAGDFDALASCHSLPDRGRCAHVVSRCPLAPRRRRPPARRALEACCTHACSALTEQGSICHRSRARPSAGKRVEGRGRRRRFDGRRGRSRGAPHVRRRSLAFGRLLCASSAEHCRTMITVTAARIVDANIFGESVVARRCRSRGDRGGRVPAGGILGRLGVAEM